MDRRSGCAWARLKHKRTAIANPQDDFSIADEEEEDEAATVFRHGDGDEEEGFKKSRDGQ